MDAMAVFLLPSFSLAFAVIVLLRPCTIPNARSLRWSTGLTAILILVQLAVQAKVYMGMDEWVRCYSPDQHATGAAASCRGTGMGTGMPAIKRIAYNSFLACSFIWSFLLFILEVRLLRSVTLRRMQRGDDGIENGSSDDIPLLDLDNSNGVSLSSMAEGDANANYFDPQMTLQLKDITFGNVVGEGNFGKVHAGTAKDPQLGGATIAVAIKVPAEGSRLEFETEMEIMGQVTRLGGHPHIVRVVGCVYVRTQTAAEF